MKHRLTAIVTAVMLTALCSVLFACSDNNSNGRDNSLDKYEQMLKNSESTTEITVWAYYSNDQKADFEKAVANFNRTVGREKNISVTAKFLSNIGKLYEEVENAAAKAPGADNLPNMFMIYADNCLTLDAEYGCVANLDKYFTETELNNYVQSFLDEGRYDVSGDLKIVPTAKSTELFMMNKTAWDNFAAEVPEADIAKLSTVEGITETAELYYNHTGQAFFGRDVAENYMLTAAMSLGKPIFTVDSDGNPVLTLDKAVMKKIYDNYYVPYAKGHFTSVGRFRSEDIRTQAIIACVCSTSGAGYFPTAINNSDTEQTPIEVYVATLPTFEGGTNVAISQGAGIAVSKSDEKTEYACAVFLKWFNQKEQSVSFSANSGYLPVTKDSLNFDLIAPYITKNTEVMTNAIEQALKTFDAYSMYVSPPFKNSADCRTFLGTTMQNIDNDDSFINAKEMQDAISKAIEDGTPAEAAYSSFLTEEAFESWYNAILTALTSYTTVQ